MEPSRFQLVDSEGQTHEYLLTKHLASDGTRVALRIMSLVSGPIAEALVALVGSDGALQRFADEGIESISIDALGEAMSGVSMGDLAAQLAKTLGDPATSKLMTTDLMRYVIRDGKNLSNKTEYDRAFTGNYLELFKLCMEVIKANGFLLFAPT